MMSAHPTGGILWLDLSTSIGWAYATESMPEPAWGVWRLPEDIDLGLRGMSAENELCAAMKRFAPRAIGVEAPLPPSEQPDFYTARLLIGLEFLVETVARRWRTPCFVRSCDTVRSRVCGRARRTDEEKRAKVSAKDGIVKPWVESMGWSITDHNARDAAVGLAYEFGFSARKDAPAGVAMFFQSPVRLP